jgi:NitT/TauT family transport system substrate-binding protein
MSSLKTKLRALVLASIGLAAATAAHAEDIVVTHYASLLYGTPYSVALDKGYFKEAGVDVTGILTSKGGGTSVRNMMAGDTLFAEVALPAALSAIKEGFPIKIISGGTDGSSGFWVTRPGEVINKPEDLKGKRFVFSRPKSVSESTILAILKSYNIDPSEVKMVAIGDFGAGLTARPTSPSFPSRSTR